jgi:hypothetical protein
VCDRVGVDALDETHGAKVMTPRAASETSVHDQCDQGHESEKHGEASSVTVDCDVTEDQSERQEREHQ